MTIYRPLTQLRTSPKLRISGNLIRQKKTTDSSKTLRTPVSLNCKKNNIFIIKMDILHFNYIIHT